jgi:Ca2+-binding EF-hand superfamily protein
LSSVFRLLSICQDGDGAINANELRVVIRTLLDEDPSDEEFQQILLTLDKGLSPVLFFSVLPLLTELRQTTMDELNGLNS